MSEIVHGEVWGSDDAADAACEADYTPGELVAENYELVRLLGQGGMGSVWVARNLALDVQVALKLMRHDVDSPLGADRLLAEARTAAQLKHPGIVRVFDFGRTRRGEPFIVMELLQGESLGDRLLREHKLSAAEAVQLLLPIADALSVAHAKQIVHRDLKPDNVFLARQDNRLQPKLVDFGVAQYGREANRGADRRLTQEGTVVGSPDYMAPEQARGDEALDHRVDVWAFCVVLFECLTGRVPFEDSHYQSLLTDIIDKPVPSILEFGVGDADLARILERGFQKDKAERWPSMSELGTALAEWLVVRGIDEDVCGQGLRNAWIRARSAGTDSSQLPARAAAQPAVPRLSTLARSRALPRQATRPGSNEVALTASKHPERPRSSLGRTGALLAITAPLALGIWLGTHLSGATSGSAPGQWQGSAAPNVAARPSAPSTPAPPSALESVVVEEAAAAPAPSPAGQPIPEQHAAAAQTEPRAQEPDGTARRPAPPKPRGADGTHRERAPRRRSAPPASATPPSPSSTPLVAAPTAPPPRTIYEDFGF